MKIFPLNDLTSLKTKNLLLSAVALVFLSCQSQSQQNWNPGMELRTYNGGGMVPKSETVEIKGLNGLYIRWALQKTDSFHFKLTQQEADTLLEEFNAVHFNKMVSGEKGGIKYDYPTTSIVLKSGDKKHEVDVSATTEITSGKAEDFFSLYNYVLDYATRKTGQNR